MPKTAQELRAEYARQRSLYFIGMAGMLAKCFESPIEEQFFWALLTLEATEPTAPNPMQDLTWVLDEHELPGQVARRDGTMLKVFSPSDVSTRTYYLQPQIQSAAGAIYRLDVGLRLQSIHWRDLFVHVDVECDGHDFHERTALQAEHDKRRDRELQATGWTIARLTGAEIHRDPIAAAESVIELAYGVLRAREAEKRRPA